MYERILAAARSAVWCLSKPKLEELFDVLELRASGGNVDAATIQALAADSRSRADSRSMGEVGVLPVIGTIVHRGNMITEASGTASSDVLGKQFTSMVNNPDVSSIVFDFDSPGGQAAMIQELAAQIAAARGTKPIVAVVNPEAGSAAYWLATAADEIVVTPSGEVGSIGAYAYHVDYSAQNEMLGVKPTYISYGEHKTEANADEPLTDEAMAQVQASVDRVGKQFESDVAKYRGTTVADVRKNFGQGRMVEAERAVSLGMADRIGTFRETIQRVATGDNRRITRRPKIERARLTVF